MLSGVFLIRQHLLDHTTLTNLDLGRLILLELFVSIVLVVSQQEFISWNQFATSLLLGLLFHEFFESNVLEFLFLFVEPVE